MANPLAHIAMLPEPDLIEFIDDTIYFMKGNKVPFLSKFYKAFGNESRGIVQTRDLVEDIIQLALRKTTSGSTIDNFKDSVTAFLESKTAQYQLESCPLGAKQIEVVAITIFARREELALVLTELCFRRASDSYLIDYNFNIETVMSSDSYLKVNEPILVLELFLSKEE
jgi:hypothetical protein